MASMNKTGRSTKAALKAAAATGAALAAEEAAKLATGAPQGDTPAPDAAPNDKPAEENAAGETPAADNPHAENMNTPDPRTAAELMKPLAAWSIEENRKADSIKSLARQTMAFAQLTYLEAHALRHRWSDENMMARCRLLAIGDGDMTREMQKLLLLVLVGKRPPLPKAGEEQEEIAAENSRAFKRAEEQVRLTLPFTGALFCNGVKPEQFNRDAHMFEGVKVEAIIPKGWHLHPMLHAGLETVSIDEKPLRYTDALTGAFDWRRVETNPQHVVDAYLQTIGHKLHKAFAPKKTRAGHSNTTAADALLAAAAAKTAGNGAAETDENGNPPTTTQGVQDEAERARKAADDENRAMLLALATASTASLIRAAAQKVPALLKEEVKADQTTLSMLDALTELDRLRRHLKAGIESIAEANRKAHAERKAAAEKKAAADKLAAAETQRIAAQQQAERDERDAKAAAQSDAKNAAAAQAAAAQPPATKRAQKQRKAA